MPSLVKFQVRTVFDEKEFSRIKRSQEVKRYWREQVGRPVWRRAIAEAPMSETGSDGRPPGYLRSQIKMREGEMAVGPYVQISTTARSPRGFRYGAYWQRRRPYLRAGATL